MDDITSYGEISTAHHKGEMSTLAFVGGCCLAFASVFFMVSGLYHLAVSLAPYWERVTVGPLAHKGTLNFFAFTLIALSRFLFGAFLGYLSMQMWDGKAGCRRLLCVIVIPVVVFIGNYVLGLSDYAFSQMTDVSVITSSFSMATFLSAYSLLCLGILISIILGPRLRDSSSDTTFLTSIVYGVLLFGGFYFIGTNLDLKEYQTALFANMTPFSMTDSGYEFIILDNVSQEYVGCIENIQALENACQKQDKVRDTKYDNFGSIPRSGRLIEILVDGDYIEVEPFCGDNGSYQVDANGKWSCTVHGMFNGERLERGRRRIAILNGQTFESESDSSAIDNGYND